MIFLQCLSLLHGLCLDVWAMFGWYRLVLVVVVVFNTSKLTHKKLTPWMFGWRC
jgi:hypothetical protein